MNITKIEWTDLTWNPISGCIRGCKWCYAEKIYHRFGRSFDPKLHTERLEQPLKIKKSSKIFTCSVADFYASWTKIGWRKRVYDIIDQCPQHVFQILTQDPQNINRKLNIPSNVWTGTTVRTQKETSRIDLLRDAKSTIRFVSFEPFLGEIETDLTDIQWVIIGAMTGPLRRKHKPEKEWIRKLIKKAKESDIPAFIKDNVEWEKKIQEYPKY